MNYEQRKLVKQKIDAIKRSRLDELKTSKAAHANARDKCKGITWSCAPCGQWPLTGQEYCRIHLDQKS